MTTSPRDFAGIDPFARFCDDIDAAYQRLDDARLTEPLALAIGRSVLCEMRRLRGSTEHSRTFRLFDDTGMPWSVGVVREIDEALK